MSKPNLSAEVVLLWGDGKYTFALKSKQLEHLEKKCNATISEIAMRVMRLTPSFTECYQTILLGLEGGGMPPHQAQFMMDRYFEGRPLAGINDEASPVATAAKVMQAAWFGMEDIPSGEAAARDQENKNGSTSDDTEQSS